MILINNVVISAPSKESVAYIEHPLLWTRSVEFRLYQKAIAESANCKNTLVILPTALGKTVISLLVCANMLFNYRDKRILIMAPTRPLVLQHMKSFSLVLKILEEQISYVTGKIQPGVRRMIWDKTDIRLVFATPEVVKNDLEESRLNLKDFSLVIFDEAHRAIKDYAYTFIAKEYVNQSPCPVILAMTASPGSERKRVQDLCNNLYIEKVEYRSEEDPDVKPYINPIDVKWEWFDLPEDYRYIASTLRSMLDERLRWLIQKGIIRKRGIEWIFKRDLIEAGEDLRYSLELTMEEQRGPLYIALMNQSSALTLMFCLELIESQGSYSLKSFLDRIDGEESNTHALLLKDPRIMEINTLLENMIKEHPKIERLVELVKKYNNHSFDDEKQNDSNSNSNSKVLIFTQYRDTARHIVEVLAKNNILSSRFVGQSKRLDDVGMKQDEQATVLESFRTGEFNVLVATSIAEEGLDIPDVGLVVFYEPIASEIRYIQRRGRTGRKSAGSVIIFAANDTVDMRYLYASSRRIEKMQHLLSRINTTLKPIGRTSMATNPMTKEQLSLIENRKSKLDNKLYKRFELDLKKSIVSNTEGSTRLDQLYKDSKQISLSRQADLLAGKFRRQIDRSARLIAIELAKAGKQGMEVETLSDVLGFEYAVLIEALKKLEKLKIVEWLDDSRVAAANSLKQVAGKVHVIYVEKIVQGKAIVTIDGSWHARLNHYDYEGPRELLKKGSEFKAIGELYKEDGLLGIRIKQIIESEN